MCILATLAVFYTLYAAASFILPLLLAMLFNLLLLPGRRLLSERLRLPSPIAALLLILMAFVVISAVGLAISLPASTWVEKAPQSLVTLEEKLGFVGPAIDFARRGLEQLQHALSGADAGRAGHLTGAQGNSAPQQALVQTPPNIGGIGLFVIEGTQAAVVQAFTLLVTLFFLLAWGDTLLRRFVEIMPSFGDKRQLVEIAEEIEHNISRYLITITGMNLLVGIGNGLSMWLQGLPDPLLWATIAFLLNYIPILGPSVGVAIFFLVGLFTTSSLLAALLPAAIYLVLHVIEGETLTPMLLSRRFTLNPVLVVVSLFFWNWLWGVPGAILAVPVLAIVKIICDRIPTLKPFGHVLGAARQTGLQA